MAHSSAVLARQPRALLVELRRREPTLATTAAVFAAAFVAFLLATVVDPRTVGGEPAWLKPAKFAGSLGLLTGTLAWLAPHLPVTGRTLRRVSTGIATGAIVEMALVGGQAARGVESHFNDATALDAAVYDAMGVAILATLLLVGVLAVATWARPATVDPAFARGIRLGFGTFVLGSLVGVVMVAAGVSAVGAGATVPLVGWSTGGDLRIAHFVGLHGLQVLPVVGYLAGRGRGHLWRPVGVVATAAGLLAVVLLLTLLHALSALGW